MSAFFYGDFIYFFVGGVSVLAGYGLSLFYKGRQLLGDARPHGEQLIVDNLKTIDDMVAALMDNTFHIKDGRPQGSHPHVHILPRPYYTRSGPPECIVGASGDFH